MKCRQISPIQNVLLLLIITSGVIFLSSCNQDRKTSQTTGALALRIAYHGTNDDYQPRASEINCREQGISIIEAKVFDKKNNLLAYDAWGCERHQGTLDVKAGSDRTVVILGKDDNENVLLRGEASGINVKADRENKIDGPIDCYDFVPKLKSPEISAPVQPDTALLEWNIIPGAKQYRVVVWKDSSLKNLHTEKTTTETNYSLTDLGEAAYYWQVIAIDAQGNESTASATGSNTALLFSVAAGKNHTLAIKPDGTLWSWGSNNYGQLGIDDGREETARSTPTQVGSDTDWTRVAAGTYHSAAIKTDGTLWTWGFNENHELGHGPDTNGYSTPTQIGSDKDWDFVTAGDHHTIAKKTDGTLWGWGANSIGQLGLGHNEQSKSRPVKIDSGDWALVTAAGGHTLAVKNNGQLWAWGDNVNDQLGTGDSGSNIPTLVDSAGDWAFVDTASDHTIAVKTTGELWAWGDNEYGQLGRETTDNHSTRPVRVNKEKDWAYAAATAGYTIAIKKSGQLWAWGSNDYGQLGLGDTDQRFVPENVSEIQWAFVSAQDDHTTGMSIDGKVWCWGKNTSGEIGNGIPSLYRKPQLVNTDKDWDFISAGTPEDFSLVKKKNGELWAWGRNDKGQLGVGNDDIITQITPMKIGTDEDDWIFITSGSNYTLAIKQTAEDQIRTLWGWGDNKKSPEKESDDEGWDCASIGGAFGAAIKENTLWTWGDNCYGQLGIGKDKEDQDKPIQVGIDTDWASDTNGNRHTIASGHYHTVAIKNNGTLWTWGKNDIGQLGLDHKISQYIPQQVGTDTDWYSVASSKEHTIAIKIDGSLWAWGNNAVGQLGLGDKQYQTTPEPIGENDNSEWTSVSTGFHHAAGIKADGTLWAWGDNSSGQLGIEDINGKTSTPVQVGTDTDWVNVGCGGSHTLAIKKDDTLWSWGDPSDGRLGYEDASETLPVHILLKASD